jgi:flagellar assembly factor FliW
VSVPLHFVAPPLGFSELVDFSLNDVEGADGLYALRADSGAGVRLYVIDAAVHLPQYLPVISDEQSATIGLTSSEDASVLVVANPAEDGTTVNLLAPIVINTATGSTNQFILEDDTWSVREPLRA